MKSDREILNRGMRQGSDRELQLRWLWTTLTLNNYPVNIEKNQLFCINSLAPGIYVSNCKNELWITCYVLRSWILLVHYSLVNTTEHLGWRVNIGSGNGLVPSGNKPLPEAMLTQIYVAIFHNSVTFYGHRSAFDNNMYAMLCIWSIMDSLNTSFKL